MRLPDYAAGQTGGNGVATKGVNYAYNLAGQVTSQVDYTQLGNNPPAIVTGAYSYDNTGRLTGIDYTHSTTTLDDMTWTLDAAGRVEDFTSSVDGTAAYSYDNANQLLGAFHATRDERSSSWGSGPNRTLWHPRATEQEREWRSLCPFWPNCAG